MYCIIQSIMQMKVCYARSKYFKTALSTDVGTQNKVIEVEECSPHVLTKVIDFMYGISLPEYLSIDDAKSVLTMADLYLMEDLKDAVAPHLAKQLSEHNILETAKMAEKYNAQKLMEFCSDFILTNIPNLDGAGVLGTLLLVTPLVAKLCFQKQQNRIEDQQNQMDVFKKVLGVNLATSFKKRKDFKSDLEYKEYMINNTKPNMLVLCNKTSTWRRFFGSGGFKFEAGAVGRLISSNINGPAVVMWSTLPNYMGPWLGSFLDLDLFTTPIQIDSWLSESS